jgi:hypothetical protein
MKFLVTSVITALLMTYAIPVQSQQAGDQSGIPAEEYAIYAAVIGNMFADDKVSFDSQSKVKTLVIESRTVSNIFATALGHNEGERVKKQFPSISQETIDDFAAKNAKTHQLTTSFDLKLKYTIPPKERIEQIFKSRPDAWDEFYRQFPDSGGFIALSRAGLNSGSNQALVYLQHSCGMLCGSGHYLLLVKNDRGWVVQKKVMAWIS